MLHISNIPGCIYFPANTILDGSDNPSRHVRGLHYRRSKHTRRTDPVKQQCVHCPATTSVVFTGEERLNSAVNDSWNDNNPALAVAYVAVHTYEQNTPRSGDGKELEERERKDGEKEGNSLVGPQKPRAEDTVTMCPLSNFSIPGRNSLTV